MNKFYLTAIAAAFAFACESEKRQTETEIATSNQAEASESDWENLFDGNSLEGWSKYGGGDIGNAWKVQDGAIYLDATNKANWKDGDGGDIVTKDEFENFHLKYDWKISKNGNSGVMFFVNDSDEYPHPWSTGPEMQVLDNDGHPDAKIRTHRAGDLYDLIESSEETVKPVGEWNTAEIIADNGKLELHLNGTKIVETTLWDDEWNRMVKESKFKDLPGFGKYKKGKIALQDHGDEVWFRNLQIKKL